VPASARALQGALAFFGYDVKSDFLSRKARLYLLAWKASSALVAAVTCDKIFPPPQGGRKCESGSTPRERGR
jgi:hypothetical protein